MENTLVGQLVQELGRSRELARTLSAEVYAGSGPACGSVGAHIRHSLDFIACLLKGVRIGLVDYASRERDARVESDQRHAAERIEQTIFELGRYGRFDLATLLLVRSEFQPEFRHASSFARELEFVLSHTVHHHALINERLSMCGIATMPDLGVGPSTERHWNKLRLAA